MLSIELLETHTRKTAPIGLVGKLLKLTQEIGFD